MKIKRLRHLKMYGNTYVITLSKVDMEDMGFKEGDLIDISELKKEIKK